MDYLSQISSWASIISLIISFWAIYAVRGLRATIRDRAMDSQLRSLAQRIQAIPIGKKVLTASHRTDLASFIRLLDDFYTSRLFWKDREIKTLRKRLKDMLSGNPAVQEVKDLVSTIESQTLQTARI